MELMHASNQWASRPADEHFASLEEMHQAVDGYRKISAEKVCLASELTVEVTGDRPVLLTPAAKAVGRPVDFTNYSFGQLARLVSAPAGYLAGLPAPLAAECMNLGLQRRAKMEGGREQLKAYIAQNGITELRAMTSTSYARIYDVELTSACWPSRLRRAGRSGRRRGPPSGTRTGATRSRRCGPATATCSRSW
jgi:hypothetical protein